MLYAINLIAQRYCKFFPDLSFFYRLDANWYLLAFKGKFQVNKLEKYQNFTKYQFRRKVLKDKPCHS